MNADAGTFYARIALRIRELRQERGWTQEELALRAGTEQSTVSLWESGRKWPLYSSLKRLAAAFGVELEELV